MATDRDAENIDRLRSAYAAFSRGAFDEAVEAGVHPDFEYVPAGGLASIRGIERFRTWMEPDAFDVQTVEPLGIEMNGDRALVRQHTQVRGAASGIEVETYTWGVWTIDDDGMAIRLEIFQDDDEADARRAAGLG